MTGKESHKAVKSLPSLRSNERKVEQEVASVWLCMSVSMAARVCVVRMLRADAGTCLARPTAEAQERERERASLCLSLSLSLPLSLFLSFFLSFFLS